MRPSEQGALAAFLLVGAWAGAARAGEWTHPRHDADGTNRASDAARIRNEPGFEPGFRHVVEGTRRALAQPRLHDVDGDGEPELLVVNRGRVAAIDTSDGSFRWQSVGRDFDRIAAIVDLDGDGSFEVVASASSSGTNAKPNRAIPARSPSAESSARPSARAQSSTV